MGRESLQLRPRPSQLIMGDLDALLIIREGGRMDGGSAVSSERALGKYLAYTYHDINYTLFVEQSAPFVVYVGAVGIHLRLDTIVYTVSLLVL